MPDVVGYHVGTEVRHAGFLPTECPEEWIPLDLPEACHLFQAPPEEHRAKAPFGEVAKVVRVHVHRGSGRDRGDDHASRKQQTAEPSQQGVRVANVLESLERDDGMEARPSWNVMASCWRNRTVGSAVVSAGVIDLALGDVYPDDLRHPIPLHRQEPGP